jgi:DNA topoisomerase-3
MVDVPLAAQQPPVGQGARKPRRKSQKAAAAPSAAKAPSQGITDLVCPACKQGPIIVGKRGWGCSRWRQGCKFVVWFEADGKRRNEDDLRAMVNSRNA